MTVTPPPGTGAPGPDDGAPDDGAPDQALDRLRAADPARSVEPDLTTLRASVDSRLARDLPAAAVPADGAPHPVAQPPDELAARRTRRRRLWPAIAAAAAGVLLVGSVGYGLGNRATPPAADSVISLAQGDAAAQSEAAAGSDTQTGAGVSAPEVATDARLSIYPYPSSWRTVFGAAGLSDATGTAPAWTFDPGAVFSAESATAAAAVFGLEGQATNPYGAWTVGSQDGTGPSLTLQPDGYASLSYYDPTRDPYVCASTTTPEGARTDAGPDARTGTACSEGDAGPAPSGEAVAAQMRDLLAALGIQTTVEVESTEYDVPEAGQPRMTTVNAFQVIDSQRTGVTWSATFLGGGVQSFYGPLAPLVSLGDYAVVSENDAVARLNDPRFGASWGGVMPLAATTDLARASGEVAAGTGGASSSDTGTSSDVIEPAPSDTPTVPPTLEPGAPVPWPVTEVTITGARLGLALQWLTDGAAVLLPAYELTDDDGGTWSVIAVADEALDFATD